MNLPGPQYTEYHLYKAGNITNGISPDEDKATEIMYGIFDHKVEEDRREYSIEDFMLCYEVTQEVAKILYDYIHDEHAFKVLHLMWRGVKLANKHGLHAGLVKFYWADVMSELDIEPYDNITDKDLLNDIITTVVREDYSK